MPQLRRRSGVVVEKVCVCDLRGSDDTCVGMYENAGGKDRSHEVCVV